MRYFIKWILVFSLPLLLWVILVVLIDPYNYLKVNLNIIDNRLKRGISSNLNRPLFQLLDYKNHPTPNIILGDSRANSLKSVIIKKYSKKDFANLAYGGGSIQEVINTFWEVAENNDLKNVYIGLSFQNYNKYSTRDRVTEAIAIKKNFFTYAFSPYTFESTFLILKSVITRNEIKIGVPTSSKDNFWIYQLNVSVKQDYEFYEYPSNYFHDLEDISKFCFKHGINLVFFIPPTHIDLQNKVKEYNLQVYEAKFRNDLQKIGDLYDFDYPSNITKNKNNFNDPYHCIDSIGEIIVKELFSLEPKRIAKYTKFNAYNKIQ